jgi:hypothetical protein
LDSTDFSLGGFQADSKCSRYDVGKSCGGIVYRTKRNVYGESSFGSAITNNKRSTLAMADVTAMLVGELEVINDDHIELDLIDEYAYPIADRNLVINQRIRLGPTPFVGITNYVQVTVWRYSNDAFKRHFRMSRDAYVVWGKSYVYNHCSEVSLIYFVQRLLHRFTHYSPFSTVSHNVKLLLFLWTIGNQESFRTVGDRFGMLPGDKNLLSIFV